MQSIISPTNWNYCRFESGPYRAFVSFGADVDSRSQGDYLYFVTVTEGEDREMHQECFRALSEACLNINQKYGDWSFVDPTIAKEGCGSCQAH